MATAESKLDTPLMRQYQALKASCPDSVLFFRLGDFYEMFGEDAKTASPVLGLVLTSRQGLPMCGVPAHASSGYIAKLLKAGRKVAVAEQMEDPAKAKGLVKRQVVRLITPGTVVEDELLDAASANYLASIELDRVGWGLACVDVSTGEFWACQTLNDPEHRRLISLLARIDPAEALLKPRQEGPRLDGLLPPGTSASSFDPFPSPPPIDDWGHEALWRNGGLAAKAAWKALRYIMQTQPELSRSLIPSYRELHADLQLDETAVRTLELTCSSTGERRHSLWGVLDRCRTSMGSRKLKLWILHPLLDVREIERRQNCVEELFDKADHRRALSQILAEISDLERVSSRLATRAASPRDLAALRDSLVQLDALRGWFRDAQFCSALSASRAALEELAGPLQEAHRLLERALADHPPARSGDGGIVRPGFDPRLDELRSIKEGGRQILAEMEARERSATGIGSLKVGYTSVFGYYLEVTKPHLAKVPAAWHRKQTLANAERFITPELKELELKVLGAEDRILRLEAELFDRLRAEALLRRPELVRFASLIAELDVLGSLAEAACLNDYVKPKVDLSHDLVIEEGRHPVLESLLPPGTFVSNSLALNGLDSQIVVLTGPNMGGKSTYLRQNALIAVMAQMGSFVPAKSALIGIIDKVLTRIGAQDALSRNESTFMVEMRETSHILRSATPRSLVILDEVGRGTSTFDGISIAWAVLEHLCSKGRARSAPRPPAPSGSIEDAAAAGPGPAQTPQGPRTLFATHYFELTQLAETHPGIRNANVEAREWTDAAGRSEVVFLHKIAPGPADRSFGIHVAQLAGLPPQALERAREILADLESKSRAAQAAGAVRAGTPPPEPMLPLFEEHPVLRELRLLRADELTPLEALNRIARWKLSL